jgi:bifunctional non-homologous end joining protein LigD
MENTRSTTLYCREGSSDKEYQLWLEQSGDGYLVNFAFGRRGASLKQGTKTQTPVSYEAAEKIYDKLLREKTSKGYTEAESGMRYVGTDLAERDSGLAPQLPTAILPKDVSAYEKNPYWVAQEKYDGENRMIIIENGTITGVNRRGLTCPVPEHWNAQDIVHDTGRTVLCGEDMGAHLVVFDMVEYNGKCIRNNMFTERHAAILGAVMHNIPEWLKIAPVAHTEEEKRSLLQRMIEEEGEGIVYKRKDASFDAGRSPNALKHKIQESSTFEVVKVNDQRSVAIALYDENSALIPMGNVTVPANYPIPEVGALVEVEYMYRFEDGALMQPKYKGERSDVEGPVRLDQIKRIKPKSMAA